MAWPAPVRFADRSHDQLIGTNRGPKISWDVYKSQVLSTDVAHGRPQRGRPRRGWAARTTRRPRRAGRGTGAGTKRPTRPIGVERHTIPSTLRKPVSFTNPYQPTHLRHR
jgi:hypothetical protein